MRAMKNNNWLNHHCFSLLSSVVRKSHVKPDLIESLFFIALICGQKNNGAGCLILVPLSCRYQARDGERK
jgi:hypothetical protein